jgi:hypothetical protein
VSAAVISSAPLIFTPEHPSGLFAVWSAHPPYSRPSGFWKQGFDDKMKIPGVRVSNRKA